MHAEPPALALQSISGEGAMLTRQGKKKAGFSLVEVTLAIGIIAFAFVALLGLIPTGLGVFRESIDTANEMWIVQNLNSMIQVTPWKEVENLKNFTFYYDEEGRLTDREATGGGGGGTQADAEVLAKRLYAVKLVFGDSTIPGVEGSGSGSEGNFTNNSFRAVAVFAPYLKPKSMEEFNRISTVDDIHSLTRAGGVKTRAFLVSRMDSLREP